MPVRVKCCGLTRLEDVRAAVQLGADYLGFVFAPGPRSLTLERAEGLSGEARALGFPGGLVGVFVDAAPELLEEAAMRCDLDILQLHGGEDPRRVAEASALRPVWKVLHVRADSTPSELLAAAGRHAAAAYLLDTHAAGRAGGTGVPFPHELAAGFARAHPTVLAGGLTAENVIAAIRVVRPFAVDVSSGIESSPGVKDRGRIAAFLRAARAENDREAG